MGGSSRFIMLLAATPFPHLHPRPTLLRLTRHSRFPFSSSSLTLSPHLLSLSPVFRSQHGLSVKSSQHIHTRTSAVREEDSLGQSLNLPVSHPWPEWSKFIDVLSSAGYFDQQGPGIAADDAFVAYEELPEEFVRAANACLVFARGRSNLLGSLSRGDIGVVVENGTPFLFKSSLESARRMRSFLGISGGYGLEYEEVQMVDLMKYLLSYASKPTLSSDRILMNKVELVESSVRNLLIELAGLSCGMPASQFSSSVQHQFLDCDGQKPRPIGPKIEMKRGDWICPRCNFMNFARNNKCLECEGARPKRQLIGGEWECPQCDFYNYGRNAACLRCDCKRPGEAPFRSTNGHPNGSNNNHTPFMPLPADMFAKKPPNSSEDGEKAATESSVSASLKASEQACTVSRNRESEQQDDVYIASRPLDEGKSLDKEKEQAEKSGRWFKRLAELHNVTDLANAIPDEEFPEIMPMRKGENRFVVSKKNDRSLTSPMYRRKVAMEQASSTRFVPFVPFPPDYFAKDKKQADGADLAEEATRPSPTSITPVNSGDARPALQDVNPVERMENTKTSTGSSTSESPGKTTNKRMISGIYGAPTNSKLMSDLSNFQVNGQDHPIAGYHGEISGSKSSNLMGKLGQQPNNSSRQPGSQNLRGGCIGLPLKTGQSQQTDPSRWSSGSFGGTIENEESGIAYGVQIHGNSMPGSSNSQGYDQNQFSIGYSRPGPDLNLTGASSQLPDSQSSRSGWSRNSLEGSAVQALPDPLDMSEEAKAQRWFRRVAQIKDISELSQIPDEDFPSIMPMRKGVNRFVVSKRKTPLERRLTSSQYRKNLPTVNSDPMKKEGDES